MNQKEKIIEKLQRNGRTPCIDLEQPLVIRDATSRISAINKQHRSRHGRNLIKATEVYETNLLGKMHAVTYYEIDTDASSPDLFS